MYEPFRLALLKGPLPLEVLLEPHPSANASNPHRPATMILFVNLEETILQEDSEAALALDTTTPPPLIVKVNGLNPRLRAKLRTLPSARAPRPASLLPQICCLYRIGI